MKRYRLYAIWFIVAAATLSLGQVRESDIRDSEGVDSIAALSARTSPDGNRVIVNGYYAAGDAGEPWEMTYHATGRTGVTLNGGTLVTGPGADDYWEAADTLNAYPRRFGARDGLDSTTQLQACVDACSNVIIDACDYRTSAAIVVPDNVTITGIGWQSKITQTAIGHNLLEIASDNVTVSGLHLIGVGTTSDTLVDADNGIYSVGSLNLLVEKCFIEQLIGSGIDLRNTINMTIRDNTFFRNPWALGGGAATQADIKTYGAVTTPDRLVITGNRCLSNNSQGIYVSPLGGTNQVIVTDNICITLDPATCIEGGTWAELAKGSVSRRHGIIIGYGASTATQTICTGNICGNTKWTGIYKQGETTGGVLIAHNYCFLNGDVAGGTTGLQGGIWVNCTGGNEVIRDNFIERNQCYGINLRGGGGTSNSWSVCSGNKIKMEPEEGQHGIYVQIEPRKMRIANNSVSRTGTQTNTGIYLEPGSGQTAAAEIDIDSNQVSGFSDGIGTSNQSGNMKRIDIAGNSLTDLLTSGVSFGGVINTTISVTDNYIDTATNGIKVSSYSSGRVIWDCARNTMKNLTNGFDVSATATTHSVIVGETIFDTVTNQQISSIGSDVVRFGHRISEGVYEFPSAAAPTIGSHVVGDRVNFTTPTAGGSMGAVCTVTGSPGTWKSYGAIDP